MNVGSSLNVIKSSGFRLDVWTLDRISLQRCAKLQYILEFRFSKRVSWRE